MEQPPTPGPRKRVSDAEREETAKHLGDAFAEGRLDLEEFDRRNTAAHEAVFDDELRDLVTDLPAPGEGAATPHRRSPAVEEDVVELFTEMATLRRRGDWAVPRRLRVSSRYGGVRLDMGEATIRHPVVEIELAVHAAGTLLVLPEGATANVDELRTKYANVYSKVAAAPRSDAVHFVVRGETYAGSVRIRYARGRKR
ncbi:DUF1707 SHOCT-like domain-containing protein [Streptomonospora litoralis]|uniref:DUF1707 domain-containing protein n=1 Tax=Streptomonospora litoralis TaxID=2498135 RepID=A0A4P6PXE5_9ACTN|nr:DUF1707 domain-containing protein [Streptomonospora litoralis]QBI52795.1 hypothetical protein EKD16_04940 [Streptomonospora litoralis]